jgi:hypothetical protein
MFEMEREKGEEVLFARDLFLSFCEENFDQILWIREAEGPIQDLHADARG